MKEKSPSSRWRSLGLTLPFAISLFPAIASAACNTGDAGGVAYLELPVAPGGQTANTYGQREANEPGLAGITVKVTDNAGTEQVATTDASGNWSVAAPAFPVRVEFIPSAGLQSGAAGSQSQSSVRFLDATSCNTDIGFQHPEDYSQPNPRVVIPVYRSGTGDGSTDEAIHSFPRSNTGLNSTYTDSNGTQGTGPVPDVDALIGAVGSTWGIGWQADKKRVFAASFLKRHTGIQNGLGYVYVLDEKTVPGTLTGKFNLQGVTPANGGAAIDLGSVCRDASCATAAGMTGNVSDYELPADKGSPSVDLDAFYKVGKVGFGDIDMQPSSNLLWLVNANQQALITVDVGNSDVASLPGAVNQYKIADLPGAPTCAGGSLRPWALGFASGKGYLGVTCDAYTSQSAADLKSSVLAFDPSAISAGFTTQLTFPLGYSRDSGAAFLPWLDVAATNSQLGSSAVKGQVNIPQPLLSDIEFDDNGNMYLNIMDIFPHQTGNYNYKPFSGETGGTGLINGIANGDFLKACKTASGFALEGDKDCPVNFANGVGPNAAGEFFEDNAGDGRAESATGAMAVLHGSGQIDAVLMDPHPTGQTGQQWWTSQGINSYNLSDGKVANWYSIHHADQPGMFGKGSGLGDIELMTDPAPVEVGNRVWLDTDRDGIQDANEAGIDGVAVKLVCGSDEATAITANGGQFLFSSVTNATFMSAGESCKISVNSAGQTPLDGLSVTTQNADNVTDNNATTDLRDSDATSTGEIAFTVGNVGENNHTLDIGYKSAPAQTDLKLTKTASKSTAKKGDTLSYLLTLENTSDVDATGVIVNDKLPTGVTYVDHLPVIATYDKTSGDWSVGSVPAKTTVTLTINVTVD
jgi:uncharacterized repeat protein (TIGR01451 family)